MKKIKRVNIRNFEKEKFQKLAIVLLLGSKIWIKYEKNNSYFAKIKFFFIINWYEIGNSFFILETEISVQ